MAISNCLCFSPHSPSLSQHTSKTSDLLSGHNGHEAGRRLRRNLEPTRRAVTPQHPRLLSQRRVCFLPHNGHKANESRTERSDAVLSLPDELLLKIADCIDGDGASLSLRQLALAHRRFRPIAHETLIRNGVVSVNRISDYIVALSQHCKWNGRIEKVTNTECGFEAVAGLARRRAIKAADKFLRQTWPDIPEGDKSTLLQAERKAPIWTQLLFVVLGDLKELSFVSMDKVWCVIYMEDVLNAVLFYDDFANIIPRLNRLIRGKLQTLSAVVLELDNQDLGHTRLPCSAICVKFRSPSAFRVDPLPAISSSTIIPSTKVSAVSAPIGN